MRIDQLIHSIILEMAQLEPITNGPPQPRGLFTCRICNSVDKVPVCRMLNHVRTFHMDNLTEVKTLNIDLWE